MDHLKRRITITHPFHPRHPEEFELVSYRRSWGREYVDCRDVDGELVTIPLQWTDATGVMDPFLERPRISGPGVLSRGRVGGVGETHQGDGGWGERGGGCAESVKGIMSG